MRKIATILLATAAMLGAAQADERMDAYSDCWSAIATTHLNKSGTTKKTMVEAVQKADKTCSPQKDAVVVAGGDADAQRSYMETALHRANPIPDEQQTASLEPEREKDWNTVYAKRKMYGCAWVNDIGKFSALVRAKRVDLALALDCKGIAAKQKLPVIDRIGSEYKQVLVEDGGRTYEVWVESTRVEY